jgi:hypothetical protein
MKTILAGLIIACSIALGGAKQGGMMPGPGTPAASSPSFGCPTGSGSCYDNFVGTSGTALNTYNSNWFVDQCCGSSVQLAGSGQVTSGGGGYNNQAYSLSTSSTSQLVVSAATSGVWVEGPCVRMTSTGDGGSPFYSSGYCLVLVHCCGTGQLITTSKNGNYFSNNVTWGGTITSGVTHTFKIVASGTSCNVTINYYIDGVNGWTDTDTSSCLGSGYSGFMDQDTTNTLSAWHDH